MFYSFVNGSSYSAAPPLRVPGIMQTILTGVSSLLWWSTDVFGLDFVLSVCVLSVCVFKVVFTSETIRYVKGFIGHLSHCWRDKSVCLCVCMVSVCVSAALQTGCEI